MLRIAIDGACRNNGRPDCISSAGVFILNNDTLESTIICSAEIGSTNQRGELHALKHALQALSCRNEEAQIITDSEYIFNAMTKAWYKTWLYNDWKTSTGSDVKNADLWLGIAELMASLKKEVHFYHIKGHCIPFGTVAAEKLLTEDTTGMLMYKEALNKYDIDCIKPKPTETLKKAQRLSMLNNGFILTAGLLKEFVALNVTADAIASRHLAKYNS